MDIIVNKATLVNSLSFVIGVAGKKKTMPILNNAVIDAKDNEIEVSATDLDIFSKNKSECVVNTEGKVLVNAHGLLTIAKALPGGDVHLFVKGQKLKVECQKINYDLPIVSDSEYPNIPDFGSVDYHEFSTDIFIMSIDRTLFSVADNDPRMFLNGAYVSIYDGKCTFVSTDGHRLSKSMLNSESKLSLEKPVIVPRSGLVEARKVLESCGASVELGFSATNMFIRTDKSELIVRLIEGEFPDYNMVIPNSTSVKSEISRTNLIEALKRVSIMTNKNTGSASFEFDNDELVLSASDADKGNSSERIQVEHNGESVKIGINAAYVIEAVGNFQSDVVEFNMTDSISPCVITGQDDSGFLHVVMPMRIDA